MPPTPQPETNDQTPLHEKPEGKLIAERENKLALWAEHGWGYASRYDRTHTSELAREYIHENDPRPTKDVMAEPRTDTAVCGRIMNVRDMGKLSFLRIRDAEGDFQVCLAASVLGDQHKTLLRLLDLGDFCGFRGEFFLTKHGEPSLMAVEVTPLSKALRPLPEKFHGVTDRETLYRQRYLDLATNPDTFQRFLVRTKVVNEIRRFLNEKNFQEIESRILQPQAGGAMARVFATHHNAYDAEFVLRIALEIDHKIIMAGGIERLYEIGKCFRNEGTDPSHLQEFTMLEWYAAYADLSDNMAWTEAMIKQVMLAAVQTHRVTVLDKDDQPQTVDFSGEWPRVTFAQLLADYAELDMFAATRADLEEKAAHLGMAPEEIEKTGRGNLLDFIYKKTARPQIVHPTFVFGYPSDLKPLARPNADGTADCYQLVVAGWEIVNSYGELIDPRVQRELLEAQAAARAAGDDEAMDVDEAFLTAMEHGLPPMTGFGMGIDRFVALITGQPNLRDVVLLPLMKRK